MLTYAILEVCRTRNVGHAGVERYKSVFLHKFIDTRSTPTMARSGDIGTTVEHELDRRVDIGGQGTSGNFDSIGQRRERPMGETRSTILG